MSLREWRNELAIERLQASVEHMMRKPIGQLLVEEGLITAEQLEGALQLQHKQGGRIGEILVKQGMVTAEDIAAVYSLQMNLPLIDLQRHVVQPDALRLVPEEMARKRRRPDRHVGRLASIPLN